MKPRRLRGWLAESSPREIVEMCYIGLLALLAEIAVRVVPLPMLARALGIAVQNDPWQGRTPAPSQEVARRARLVDTLYRHWPRRNSCLRRAAVLGYRLRAWHPVLVIGIERGSAEMKTHAWIEVGGTVIGEETADFAPLRSARGTHER